MSKLGLVAGAARLSVFGGSAVQEPQGCGRD